MALPSSISATGTCRRFRSPTDLGLAALSQRPSYPYLQVMPRLITGTTTFGELDRIGRAIEVECGRCGHREIVDSQDPRIANRRVSGARYRCSVCAAIGLPTILDKPRRLSGERLARHARGFQTKPKTEGR
jgi:predicted RNA-binding Zn-ribbon protein involved in translation (DUF1610 family)